MEVWHSEEDFDDESDWIDYDELYPREDYDEFDDCNQTYVSLMAGLEFSTSGRIKWVLRRWAQKLLHKIKYIGRRDPYDDIPF